MKVRNSKTRANGTMRNMRTAQWTRCVIDPQFRQRIPCSFLNPIERGRSLQRDVSQGNRKWVAQRCDVRQTARRLQHLLTNRTAFLSIRFEQRLSGNSLFYQCQLPSEVTSVLHSGVHPLSTCRTMNVSRIPHEECSANPIAIDLSLIDSKFG